MERNCPDCKIPLRGIRLLVAETGIGEVTRYASLDEKRSFWTGTYPNSGGVRAHMCGECGRILLFGELPTDKLPLASEAPEATWDTLPRVTEAEEQA